MSTTDQGQYKAAVVGAVFGVLAAILGAAVTGSFSYMATVQQNETLEETTKQVLVGEAEKSRVDFLRTQRADVYSKYLATALELENSLERYSHVFAHANDVGPLASVDPIENAEKLQTLRNAYNEWLVQKYKVQLLSPNVHDAQQLLADHMVSLYSEYVEGQAASLMRDEGRKDNWTLYTLYNEKYRMDAVDFRERFSQAAQKEIGVFEFTGTDVTQSR